MNEVLTEKNYPVENIWILKSAVRSILALVFIIPYFFFRSNDLEVNIYTIIYIALIPASIIYAVLKKVTFHYAIEDKFLTLRQGILNKQQRHIPYGVIQNIVVKQDLFDRVFGLASVTVENASMGAGKQQVRQRKVFGIPIANEKEEKVEMVGFSGNKVSIPGLKVGNAEILKGIIMQQMKANPIDDSQSGL